MTASEVSGGRAAQSPDWLDCQELRLFGQIGDDCKKWKLSAFAKAQGRQWFEPLDHFCAGVADSKRSHGERLEWLKEWLQFEVMKDAAFDDYIKSVKQDKRDWDRLYPAATAAIMLAYCEDRRSERA
jgi:hypothetical protein